MLEQGDTCSCSFWNYFLINSPSVAFHLYSQVVSVSDIFRLDPSLPIRETLQYESISRFLNK